MAGAWQIGDCPQSPRGLPGAHWFLLEEGVRVSAEGALCLQAEEVGIWVNSGGMSELGIWGKFSGEGVRGWWM